VYAAQLLAAILAIGILAVLTFVADLWRRVRSVIAREAVLCGANALARFGDFNRGILDSGSVIYFLSAPRFSCFWRPSVQESRRWR